eukprot:9585462-Alexandrium_andersonii.AAC.1
MSRCFWLAAPRVGCAEPRSGGTRSVYLRPRLSRPRQVCTRAIHSCPRRLRVVGFLRRPAPRG